MLGAWARSATQIHGLGALQPARALGFRKAALAARALCVAPGAAYCCDSSPEGESYAAQHLKAKPILTNL